MLILIARISTVLVFTAAFFQAFGQEATQENTNIEIPARFSLPWKSLNYSREFLSRNREIFKNARKTWEKTLIQQPLTWEKYLEDKGFNNILLNLKKLTQEISVGAGTALLGSTEPLSFEPLICPLGDQTLVLLTITHTVKQHLISAGHFAIATKELRENSQNPDLSNILQNALTQATQRALAQSNSQNQIKQDALQIKLSSGKKISRPDYGSSRCLNLLISEALAQQGYQVLRSTGLENLMIIRNIHNIQAPLYRATRNFLMKWTFSSTAFPINLNLKASAAEAVFANSIKKHSDSQWIFALEPEGNLKYTINEEFLSFIDLEKKALLYESSPSIIKIHKAWAYVDKGRAWGLKMKDRLISKELKKEIKGHVVGFFGPEMGLKNKDGQAIHEGAIIYIRKGRKLLRIGQEFLFDPTKFPTPWPPTTGP